MKNSLILANRFVLAFLLVGMTFQLSDAQWKIGSAGIEDSGLQIEKGVVIVKYESESQRNWLLSTSSSPNSELYSFKIASERALFESEDIGGQLAEIRYDSDQDPRTLAKLLSKHPFIRYAEPRRLYPITEHSTQLIDPNDPQFTSQEYLSRLGFGEAWDLVRGESGNVIVAIIDGGTDWRHADLVDNVWTNPNEIESNGIDDDGNGFVDDIRGWNFANDSNDPTGLPNHPINGAHGTETAGAACAVSNNGLGVSGTSWNATLMPINAGNDSAADGLIKFGYEAILYAAKAGADIINLSWGGQGEPLRYEQEIIDMAVAEGALVVAAGGNVVGGERSRNNDLAYNVPANYRGVLSVGSTVSSDDLLASHSHFGISVDVYAPGVSVLTTLPGDRYARATGTSFASPLTAGLAALIKTAQPNLSALEIGEQIRLKALDMTPANNDNFSGILGAGRIQALESVSDFSEGSLRVSDLSYSDENNDGFLKAGERLRVSVEVEGMLAEIGNADLSLRTYQDLPFVFSQTNSISSLTRGGRTTTEFELEVPGGTVLSGQLRLRLDMDLGSRVISELILVETNPPSVFNHSNGVLALGITNEGNLGYIDENLSAGIGMAFYSDYILFEGGLLVGDSSTRVSDSIRGDDGSSQDEDFVPEGDGVISFLRPGTAAFEETAVRFDDSGSSNPMNISILQESFVFNETDRRNFALLRYTLTNQGSEPLDNVHLGLFMDFDLDSRFIDTIEFDEAARTGVMRNKLTDASVYAGVKLLSDVQEFSFSALSVGNDLDSMPTAKKWDFLSRGIQQTTIENDDIALIIASGPTSFAPGESKEFGFSVWVAEDQEEAEQAYGTAQEVWDGGLLTGSIPTESDLILPSPNPFLGSVNLSYKIAEQGPVEIDIFDSLGRKVRSLVDENKGLGSYQVRWDGNSADGLQASAGVYFVRAILGSSETVVTRTLHKL